MGKPKQVGMNSSRSCVRLTSLCPAAYGQRLGGLQAEFGADRVHLPTGPRRTSRGPLRVSRLLVPPLARRESLCLPG
jgi:hypothetical protein